MTPYYKRLDNETLELLKRVNPEMYKSYHEAIKLKNAYFRDYHKKTYKPGYNREHVRKYYYKNKEKLKIKSKKYYQKNREKFCLYSKNKRIKDKKEVEEFIKELEEYKKCHPK
ncbi:MAG: hypothetical protein WC755_07060 [Candidatus Woesearchaeota archaeon]|jgi:hypothetical protein